MLAYAYACLYGRKEHKMQNKHETPNHNVEARRVKS